MTVLPASASAPIDSSTAIELMPFVALISKSACARGVRERSLVDAEVGERREALGVGLTRAYQDV